MKNLIFSIVLQLFFLLLLLKEDKNDGEKEIFKKQKWKDFDVVIIISSIYIYTFAVYFLSISSVVYPFLKTIYFYIFHPLFFLLLITLFKFRFKQSIMTLGFEKNNLKNVVGFGMIIAFINYLLIIFFFLLIIGKPAQFLVQTAERISNLKNTLDYIMFFLITIILGPIVEECIYRGILYSPYRKKYGSSKAIIITAFMFSFSHFQSASIYSFILGISLGALYEKTESIISPIIAHSVYNLFLIITTFYLVVSP